MILIEDSYNTKKSLLKIFNRSNPNWIKPNNKCKDLVIYGSNLETSIHLSKYSSIVSYMINIPNNIIYILTGLILSDGYISYKPESKKIKEGIKTTVNSRFYIKQSIKHVSYLIYVYSLLSHYCISPPRLKTDYIKGKSFQAIEFYTRSLPCFTILRNHFYLKNKKIMPLELYDLLNYESLAHIIMGNGSFHIGGGMILNLQNFTLKELIYFINILNIKFGLKCTLHKSRNQYTVYLGVTEIKKLYPNIKSFIIPEMRYKFAINLQNS
jgi:hypothetical protein